jgi:hypothetical protein
LLMLLAVLAALLSPQPVLMTAFTVLILSTGWGIFTFGFSKVNKSELILIIFADGRVELESVHEDTIEVFLDGQQWCTHQAAVLRVADGDSLRRLVILSVQQQNADDFRRLNMWLRQNFFNQKVRKEFNHDLQR